MKNFQQNLFIVLALGLCSLCAWQWYEQTVQRDEIQAQNQMLYERDASIQNDTNSIASLNTKVDEMDGRITELKGTVTTNEQVMAAQTVQIEGLRFDNATFTNEIAQYKVAVDTLETKLKEADGDIDKQNQTITNLLAQRNDL